MNLLKVVFTHQNHLEDLIKAWLLDSIHRVSDLLGLGWGLRISISSNFQVMLVGRAHSLVCPKLKVEPVPNKSVSIHYFPNKPFQHSLLLSKFLNNMSQREKSHPTKWKNMFFPKQLSISNCLSSSLKWHLMLFENHLCTSLQVSATVKWTGFSGLDQNQ